MGNVNSLRNTEQRVTQEHLRLLEKVEQAYVQEHGHQVEQSSTVVVGGTLSSTRGVSQFSGLAKRLWDLEKSKTEDFLTADRARGFFEEVLTYCEKLLHANGIYFRPDLKKSDLIDEWIAAFDLDKDSKLTFNDFLSALQALAEATHPEISQPDHNPLLVEVIKDTFIVPSNLKKYEPTKKPKELASSKDVVPLPLEVVTLGLEVVIQSVGGADIEQLIQAYTGDRIVNNYAHVRRDIFHRHTPIPIHFYRYPDNTTTNDTTNETTNDTNETTNETTNDTTNETPNDTNETTKENSTNNSYSPFPENIYLPIGDNYPFQFHAVCFVFDLTISITDKIHSEVSTKMALLHKYNDQTFGQKMPHPVIVMIGNKVDEKYDEKDASEVMALATKCGAIYTQMSSKSHLFVSTGFNSILRIAVGNRFGFVV